MDVINHSAAVSFASRAWIKCDIESLIFVIIGRVEI